MRHIAQRSGGLLGFALAACAALCSGGEFVSARPTPLTTAFTYQGFLKQAGAPLSGSVDLQFKLFDAAAAGNQVGSTLVAAPVSVGAGQFSASIDFGPSAFDGSERWLEVAVSPPNNGSGPFTTLTPRQKLASTPYAAFALNALLPATYATAVAFNNAGNSFTGNGSGLTNLNAANLSGTLGSSLLGGTYSNAVTLSNASNSYAGSGALLGNLNASALTTGIVPSARLSGLYSSLLTFNNANNAFFGNGGGLTALNASNISAGSLDPARLPAGGSWPLTSNLSFDSGTLVIDQANNRVGIGIAAPVASLEVHGSGATTEVRVSPAIANSNTQVTLTENAAGTGGTILRHDGTLNEFQILGINNTELGPWLSVNRDNGSVGIGTASPADLLHVFAGASGVTPNSNARVIIEDDTTGFINMLTPDAGSSGVLFGSVAGGATDDGIVYNTSGLRGLQFRTGGNQNRMTITTDGNVGIGTTNPLGRLHVSGAAGDDTVRLPNDSISSAETLDEPGLASDIVGSSVTLTGTAATIASRTITVPSDGFVVAMAECSVEAGVIVGSAQPVISILKTTSPATATDGYQTYIGSLERRTISCHGVFAVSAGANAFSLNGISFGNNNSTATSIHLTLMFFPTSYGTADVEN